MENTPVIKPKQAKHRKFMLVRYGRMSTLGFFEHQETQIPKLPGRIVVKTERGLELGELVGQLCPYKAGYFKLNPEQIKKYFDDSEIEISLESAGKFIRYATPEEISKKNNL